MCEDLKIGEILLKTISFLSGKAVKRNKRGKIENQSLEIYKTWKIVY